MVEIDDKFKEAMLNRDEKLETFTKHGITEDYLIGKLKGELEAADESQRKVKEGKETKTVLIKKPIWKIQQDARKDAHKLRGDYPAEQHEHTGDVIFHSNVPEPDMPKEEKVSVEVNSTLDKLGEQMKANYKLDQEEDDHEKHLEARRKYNKEHEEEETLYVTPQKKDEK